MAEMGLLPGVKFRVISHARYGPIIISVKDTRLMLGRGMANRIQVRPAASG
jgi:Fe2+ transport system protein FeoA